MTFWRAECATTLQYLQDYPRLMGYVIRTEFPWAKIPKDATIELRKGRWRPKTAEIRNT